MIRVTRDRHKRTSARGLPCQDCLGGQAIAGAEKALRKQLSSTPGPERSLANPYRGNVQCSKARVLARAVGVC